MYNLVLNLKRLVYLFIVIASVSLWNGCSEVAFNTGSDVGGQKPFGGENPFGPECTIQNLYIEDSFERANVDDPGPNNVFGWRKIIDDWGTFVGSTGNKINAKTYTQAEMGNVPHGDRGLWFYGRPGFSVHDVYLISEPLPLVGQTEFGISLEYLPVDLETNRNGKEFIKVEVCNSTPDACGAGATLNPAGLKSANWVTVWEHLAPSGQGRDGRSHAAGEWQHKAIKIDLNKFPRDNFIFRITVNLDEGFKRYNGQTPVLTSGMEDGMIVDKVAAAAVKCVE